MKSLLLKTRLRALVLLGFAAFGLGVTASYAQIANPTVVDANVNWVSPSDAMTRLGQEINIIAAQIPFGGDNQLEYKLKYFNTVYTSIEYGDAVPMAVDANYGRFVPGILDTPVVEFPNSIPVATWQQFRQEIIQLLQN